ncbi:MAG: amidohydrolase family protein, partial [Candidatus Dormibacteraeota bacterium]|nr:amidohydrolase family protein [Candidatus Dormibacteraeota bacterium]
MTAEELGLASAPLVDHHCHAVVAGPLDAEAFDALIGEAGPAPPGASNFDTPTGLAIRAWCAPMLDLEPHASAETYLARRQELGPDEVDRRLLGATGIAELLVDTGYRAGDIPSREAFGIRFGAPTREIVRMEAVAEEVAASGVTAAGWAAAFGDELRRRAGDAVGLKSIVAYRFGFDFEPAAPDQAELQEAVSDWFGQAERRGRWRLENPTVLRHLLWTGAELGLPIQLHVGYGDPDIRLHRVNPALLHEWLVLLQPRRVPVMLLHCYPYIREAAYLAASFPDVYFDIGEVLHYTGRSATRLMAEALELAPFTKQLFSTDAFGVSEFYFLATFLFKRALAT